MKTRHLLWLPLAFGAPAALVAADALAPTPAAAVGGELAELEAEYETAYNAWKERFDASEDVGERRELRKAHPVHAFWGRFEALGAREGRAYLWMANHLKDLGLKRTEKGPALAEIYDALLQGSSGAEWFDEVISRVARDARYLGDEGVERWMTAASEAAKAPMSKALATLKLAEILSESSDKERKLRGEKLLVEYERANILTGATALDFKAQTIDEHAFKLSDYRGKAVLVDFYGFW